MVMRGRNFYEKGRDIAKAIFSVTQEMSDEENINNIRQWYGESRCNKEVIDRLTDEDRVKSLNILLNKRREAEVDRLRTTIQRKQRRGLILRVVSSAAVVALGLFLFIDSYDTGNSDEVAVSNTIIQEASSKEEKPYILVDNQKRYTLSNNEKIEDIGADVVGESINYPNQAQANEKVKVVVNKLFVPAKTTYTITLSDGTEVFLNSNSSLEYPNIFSDKSREVTLTGEAYFDIAKGDTPFVVKTEHTRTTAYGTAFNVNAYNENIVVSSLVRGSAGAVIDGGKEVLMSPAEQLQLNVSTKEIKQSTFNINKYEAWKDGYFWCDNGPVHSLLEDIGRWYDVKFEYVSTEVKNTLIIASIYREESIEKVIEIIESISSVNIEQKGGNMYVVK